MAWFNSIRSAMSPGQNQDDTGGGSTPELPPSGNPFPSGAPPPAAAPPAPVRANPPASNPFAGSLASSGPAEPPKQPPQTEESKMPEANRAPNPFASQAAPRIETPAAPARNAVREAPSPAKLVRVDADEVFSSLESKWFDDKFDCHRDLLERLPRGMAETSEFLMEEQQSMDVALDAVSSRLGKKVQDHQPEFLRGMGKIKAVDLDISRAAVHVNNSLRGLQRARKGLVRSALSVVYGRRRLARIQAITARLKEMQHFVSLDKHVAELCSNGQFAEAVSAVQTARRAVLAEDARGLACLSGVRQRLSSGASLDSVRLRVDMAVDIALRSFPENAQLLLATLPKVCSAYALLDAEGVPPGDARIDPETELNRRPKDRVRARGASAIDVEMDSSETAASEMVSLALEGGSSSDVPRPGSDKGKKAKKKGEQKSTNMGLLAARLQGAALRALKHRTKLAIVDVLLTTHRRQAISSAVQRRLGKTEDGEEKMVELEEERRKLMEQRFMELCRKVEGASLVQAFYRSCAAAVDVMHAVYVVLRWLRSPQGEQSDWDAELWTWLHAGPADEAVDLKRMTLESKYRGWKDTHTAACKARPLIWLEAQRRVGVLLTSAADAMGPRAHEAGWEVAHCLAAGRDFLRIGKEFAGPLGDSAALRGALRVTCASVLEALLRQRESHLRSMLTAEPWMLPLRPPATRAVHGIVRAIARPGAALSSAKTKHRARLRRMRHAAGFGGGVGIRYVHHKTYI